MATTRTPNMGPILVIGGCGGLGYHVVKQLIESHAAKDVAVLDIRTTTNRLPGAQYIAGSITSLSSVQSCISTIRPRTIIHTASPRMHAFHSSSAIFSDVNITGTQQLLNYSAEVGTVQAFVYTGSSSVIHDTHSDLINVTEALPLIKRPIQPELYTHTKAVAEELVTAANTDVQGGLRTCIVRTTTMFGEANETYVPHVIANARTGKLKYQVGDGRNMFDFTYAGNAAHAHILAAQALIKESESADFPAADKRVSGEAFVATNDEPWPFWETTRMIGALAGCPLRKEEIRIVPVWLYYCVAAVVELMTWIGSFGKKEPSMSRKIVRSLTMTRTFDISKIKTRLGYKPLVGMQEGLERSVQWYLEWEKENSRVVPLN